jgi:glutathione S-transferase
MSLMKLLYQTHSAFARKVLAFAYETDLAKQIEVIHHETSPTARNEQVFKQNPLGKVPVLIRPGLTPLFDSDVICAYLDTLHGGPQLIPLNGEARYWLERNLDIDSQLHVGHIALATTLSWIEFRQLPSFREQHPRLTLWLDEFERRPSMRKTPLSGETRD